MMGVCSDEDGESGLEGDSGLWTLMITTTTSIQEIDAQSDNRKRYSRYNIFFLLTLPRYVTDGERKRKIDRSIKKAKSPSSFETSKSFHHTIISHPIHQITTPALDAHMSRCINPPPIPSPHSLSQRPSLSLPRANEKRNP